MATALKIDRWNAGTMRRYHLPQAVLVIARALNGRRIVRVVPRCVIGVSVEVSPADAARQLRAARLEG